MSQTVPERSERLFTFASGGWALALAAVLVIGIVAWRASVIRQTMSIPVVGDGRSIPSYGFDLTPLLVPNDQFVAAGFPKDGLPVLTMPEHLTVDGAAELNEQLREQHLGRFIVDRQRVVGVIINGESRAYPVKILTWHEVVNDELGGIPICVTYNPLSYGVVVFDRRVAGETLEFGVSGLVYNSNLVMYDRREDPTRESLWSQLQFRAIAGPAAEREQTLRVKPCRLTRWGDWVREHPATTVLAPDLSRIKIYKRSYSQYFGSPDLRFPVEPLPAEGPSYKMPVIALKPADTWHVFSWEQIQRRVNEQGAWRTTLDALPVTFHFAHDAALRADPAVVWATWEGADHPPEVVYSFWFAWHAMHPETAAPGG